MVKLTIVRKMCESLNYSRMLKTVFEKCVDSVKPKSLLNGETLELILPNSIRVKDEYIDIKNRKCHLVGFGKAVMGMAVQIERVLGDKLVSGILSVPVGTKERFATDEDMQLNKKSVIEVYEGAKNNLPDADAEETANRIFEYVKRLTKNDVLFVLISGGGSALLPIPVAPITLSEKVDVIKTLASRGATINELNTVRIRISSSKGGKLVLAAHNAHKIVSFIISDICGDPVNLIASGPTVRQEIDEEQAKQILQKYDMLSLAHSSVIKCLSSSASYDSGDSIENSTVHIIGNNNVAIEVASKEMDKLRIRGICLSKRIEGDVEQLGAIYCKLAEAIYQLDSGQLNGKEFQNFVNSLDATLKLEKEFCVQLLNAVLDKTNRHPICLISGGETTVNIKGNGIGGRNQELALRIGSEIEKNASIRDIVFLSAGTDGIDGPCDAAGAIASLQMVKDCSKITDGNIDTYIRNNDSYSLLKRLNDGHHHIITGHTGTNVMDLHFMLIPFH